METNSLTVWRCFMLAILRTASASPLLGERWRPKAVPQREPAAVSPGSREGCRKVESVFTSPEVWGFGLALLYLLPLIVPCAPHPNRRGPGATFPPYYRDHITSCFCRALCFSESIHINHSIEPHTHSSS